jgi:hypothetical protein
LQNLIKVEHERGGALQPCGQFSYEVKGFIFKGVKQALDATPAQCLAERDADVVDSVIDNLPAIALDGKYFIDTCDIYAYSQHIRQQARQ